jgi:EAL domain-containing protein (putative c-di-GMP-specific phosphodiesterase class I)/CheY-like chemotaxis protein
MDNKNLKGLNVLVVDDSLAILKFVETILTDTFKIKHVEAISSSDTAFQLLSTPNDFNLIFLDLNMPKIDGIQLLERLSTKKYKGYLAIMTGVSTHVITSVEVLAEKYKLNYLGTLVKPLHERDFDILMGKICKSKTQKAEELPLKDYEIIRAIESDDIKVLYQPLISLSTRSFIAVEALCRINHPRIGLVCPDRFIDKAEKTDLITHITLAVIRKSFVDWQAWGKSGLHIKLSLNVSPAVLHDPDFADIIFGLLDESDMKSEDLCIEITESAIATNATQELMNLNRLSMRGVELALDDFGQNNSTIERLQKLPLNYLKLDKSYFIDQKNSLNQLSLINTSVALANKLHVQTIAEGLENSADLALATEMGCDIGQGFFIAKPMCPSKIIPWSQTWAELT